MSTKTGIILFVIFMVFFVVTGIALFSDNLTTNPSQLQTQSSNTTTDNINIINYKYEMQTNSSTLSNSMNNLSLLLGYTDIYYTDYWIQQLANEIVIIRQCYTDALSITPPTSLSAAHNKYLEGLSHYNNATYYIVDGIDNLNNQSITIANNELLIGMSCIDEATSLLNSY